MVAAASGMDPMASNSPLTIFCILALSFSPMSDEFSSPWAFFAAIWTILMVLKREELPMTAKRPILTQKMGSWA